MQPILLAQLRNVPVHKQQMELVERKGVGHPDTMCDAIMEAISVALCQAYIEAASHVLYHNIDKGLLVAGQTRPALGGGIVEAPMRLVIGDRATIEWEGQRIPVQEIAETTARRWLTAHLRFVDPQQHIVFQNELRPGSGELADLFTRERMGANDTSAAVGYAPLTETERCVLAAERWLNSPACKAQFPAAGEDVKVMGCRQGQQLALTVALAFVDRFIPNERAYFERMAAIREALQHQIEGELRTLLAGQLTRPGWLRRRSSWLLERAWWMWSPASKTSCMPSWVISHTSLGGWCAGKCPSGNPSLRGSPSSPSSPPG
jgi:S-adenosylmethionine synthetase